MAETRIGSSVIDLLTAPELKQALAEYRREGEAIERARLSGIKPVRWKIYGTVSNSALTLGGVEHQTAGGGGYISGPEQGFVWSIRFMIIIGLTAGSSPDVMNVYSSGGTMNQFWQLNGNQFCQTFGRGEIVLFPGEAPYVSNSGSLAATGQITFAGMAENVPAELIGKFY